MADREIWGFSVATTPAGKNIRPYPLMVEAVRRIDEEGATTGEIAAALGAHECPVRKGNVAARRTRGEQTTQPGPSFTEMLVIDREVHAWDADPKSPRVPSSDRIRLGAIEIELSLGYHRAGFKKAQSRRGGLVIGPSSNYRIYLATQPVDFRKGPDGLACVVCGGG